MITAILSLRHRERNQQVAVTSCNQRQVVRKGLPLFSSPKKKKTDLYITRGLCRAACL